MDQMYCFYFIKMLQHFNAFMTFQIVYFAKSKRQQSSQNTDR